MIRALLIDDEARARQLLRELLAEHHPEVQVVGEAAHREGGQALIAEHRPDLVFLDVEMPGGSGFDLLRDLGHWDFEVIFSTAHQHYAIQAIRFSALDYLPKPVQADELAAALERYRHRHTDQRIRSQVQQQFITNIAQPDIRRFRLTLTSGDRSWFVPPDEVFRCIADRNYTEIQLHDGRRFVQARTLGDLEEMLLPHGFIRVSRNALLNRAIIDHVDGSQAVLKDGERVEISRRRVSEVKAALTTG